MGEYIFNGIMEIMLNWVLLMIFFVQSWSFCKKSMTNIFNSGFAGSPLESSVYAPEMLFF
jgi:hypothetical protein